MPSIRIIGPGRAGRSLADALDGRAFEVVGLLGRHDDLAAAAHDVDVLAICTPDGAIAEVARSVRPSAATVVMHLSGSRTLDVLAPHPRRASLHPLVALPDPVTGAARLRSGVPFAVAGEPVAAEMAAALGGRPIEVPDELRDAYHAAACVAANHVVALLGQVERVATAAGLPPEAFFALAAGAVDDVAALGPRRALTGPASRGDFETLARHLDALDPAEHAGYLAGVELALRLAESVDGPVAGARAQVVA